MSQFITYRSFNDKAVAVDLCARLSENGILFQWESSEGFFDVSFAPNDILNYYYVKLRKEDFRKADELLAAFVEQSNEEPTSDYYLYSFSNTELIEVVKNPGEWNEFDIFWARRILAVRGIDIAQQEVDQAKTEKIGQLKKPWQLDKVWLIGAFIFFVIALLLVHFVWAIGLSLLGAYIAFSKKTLPDGERVNAFSDLDRFLGKITIVVGLALLLFIILQYAGVIEFINVWR